MTESVPVRIGVLALQGGVREHAAILEGLGAEVTLVRRAEQLPGIDALVLPGGESSAIDRLLRVLGLRDPLRAALADGLPALGTCAGMILLAREILDAAPGQESLGALDVAVRRNAYGRQIASAEDVVSTPDGPRTVAFIRAPRVERVGPDVSVIARRDAAVVGVRSGSVTALTFHPELSGVTAWHQELVDQAHHRAAGTSRP